MCSKPVDGEAWIEKGHVYHPKCDDARRETKNKGNLIREGPCPELIEGEFYEVHVTYSGNKWTGKLQEKAGWGWNTDCSWYVRSRNGGGTNFNQEGHSEDYGSEILRRVDEPEAW
jgi:hypothetical protein